MNTTAKSKIGLLGKVGAVAAAAAAVMAFTVPGGTHRLRVPRGIVARSLLFPTVSGHQLGFQLLEQEIARWSLPPKMHLSPSLPASDA